ncbi:hypothetical protein [Azospirillum melinis]
MTTLASNSLPVLQAGREAFERIQATGRMMREDWRLVGEALLIGRAECLSEKTGKLNNKRFGEWCQSNGFTAGPLARSATRSDAMWLAEEWERVQPVLRDTQDGANDPTTVRKAYRKATALDEQTALKAMKFYHIADAESASQAETEMAERQLKKLAESLDMPVADLVERSNAVCERLDKKRAKEITKETEEKAREVEDAETLQYNTDLLTRLARLEQQANHFAQIERQNAYLLEIIKGHGIVVPEL